MNESLSSGLGKCGTEAGNVTEVEKCCFGDLVDVGLKGEGGIQNVAKVADRGGGGNNGAVNVQGEVMEGAGEGVRAD